MRGMPRDHQFLIRRDHTHADATLAHGDRIRIRLVGYLGKLNTQVAQASADATPNLRGILADSSSEDEQIEATECTHQPTKLLAGRVAEERDSLLCAGIIASALQQVAHI